MNLCDILAVCERVAAMGQYTNRCRLNDFGSGSGRLTGVVFLLADCACYVVLVSAIALNDVIIGLSSPSSVNPQQFVEVSDLSRGAAEGGRRRKMLLLSYTGTLHRQCRSH